MKRITDVFIHMYITFYETGKHFGGGLGPGNPPPGYSLGSYSFRKMKREEKN